MLTNITTLLTLHLGSFVTTVADHNVTKQQLDQAENTLAHASVMLFHLFAVALNRPSDENIFPMVHIYVIFLWYLSSIPNGMKYIEADVPWSALVTFLNFLSRTPSVDFTTVMAQEVPGSEYGNKWRPLCEDFPLRGQFIPDLIFQTVDLQPRQSITKNVA